MSCSIIAIGGTGIRCLESFVHLCAAGLGPDAVHVVIIDPDASNGNLDRTAQLIRQYQDCHTSLYGTVVQTSDGSLGTHMPFRTRIICGSGKGQEPFTWPVESSSSQPQTLGHFFRSSQFPEDKPLCELFYSQYELNDLAWGVGFRGHASVANPALTAIRNDLDKAPMESLVNEIKRTVANHEYRMFIFASSFGATGAGGFPAISRVIRNLANDQKWPGRERLHVGGALVLPYITFDPPKDVKAGQYAEARLFPLNAQAALQHYERAWQEKCPFDSLYLAGAAKPDRIDRADLGGDSALGGKPQRNPAHVVELLAGLAALDFFSRPIERESASTKARVNVFTIAGHDPNFIDWTDLPDAPFSPEARVLKNVQQRMVAYYTSLACFRDFLWPLIQNSEFERQRRNSAWYYAHFAEGALTSHEALTSFGKLATFVSSFAAPWLWQMYKSSIERPLQLFNEQFLESLYREASPSVERAAISSRVLYDTQNIDRSSTLDNAYTSIWDLLCKTPPPNSGTEAGRFWSMVSAASLQYINRRYRFIR